MVKTSWFRAQQEAPVQIISVHLSFLRKNKTGKGLADKTAVEANSIRHFLWPSTYSNALAFWQRTSPSTSFHLGLPSAALPSSLSLSCICVVPQPRYPLRTTSELVPSLLISVYCPCLGLPLILKTLKLPQLTAWIWSPRPAFMDLEPKPYKLRLAVRTQTNPKPSTPGLHPKTEVHGLWPST